MKITNTLFLLFLIFQIRSSRQEVSYVIIINENLYIDYLARPFDGLSELTSHLYRSHKKKNLVQVAVMALIAKVKCVDIFP